MDHQNFLEGPFFSSDPSSWVWSIINVLTRSLRILHPLFMPNNTPCSLPGSPSAIILLPSTAIFHPNVCKKLITGVSPPPSAHPTSSRSSIFCPSVISFGSLEVCANVCVCVFHWENLLSMCVFVLMRRFVNVKARETPRDCQLAQTDAQLYTNSIPPYLFTHLSEHKSTAVFHSTW